MESGNLVTWNIARAEAELHLRWMDGPPVVQALIAAYNGVCRRTGRDVTMLGQRILATRTSPLEGEGLSTILRAAHPWKQPNLKPNHPLHRYLPYDFNVYRYWEPPHNYGTQRIVGTGASDLILGEFMSLTPGDLVAPSPETGRA